MRLYQTILGIIGAGLLALNLSCRQVPKDYNFSKEKELYRPTKDLIKDFNETSSDDWDDKKLTAKEIRARAQNYLTIENRLKQGKATSSEKKELEKIIEADAKLLTCFYDKRNEDMEVAIVGRYKDRLGQKNVIGCEQEYQPQKASLENFRKFLGFSKIEILAKLGNKYASINTNEDLLKNTHSIDLTDDNKIKVKYLLRHGVMGKLNSHNFFYMGLKKITRLLDTDEQDGEMTDFAFMVYCNNPLTWAEYNKKPEKKEIKEPEKPKDPVKPDVPKKEEPNENNIPQTNQETNEGKPEEVEDGKPNEIDLDN